MQIFVRFFEIFLEFIGSYPNLSEFIGIDITDTH